MKTPPGPHAMTAQAGAVAYGLFLQNGNLAWFADCTVFPSKAYAYLGQSGCTDPTTVRPLYLSQPAAVPVEALEGLVAELRNEAATIAKPYGFVTEHILGKAEGLESCVERIERLIKERSNG